MTTYKYRGHTIAITNTTTTAMGVPVRTYRIDGPKVNENRRPLFITSIRQAKEWIDERYLLAEMEREQRMVAAYVAEGLGE